MKGVLYNLPKTIWLVKVYFTSYLDFIIVFHSFLFSKYVLLKIIKATKIVRVLRET